MIAVQQKINARAESQAEIARILRVTQPRVSNLMRGKIDLFSLDTLVTLLERLGDTVDVTVSSAEEPALGIAGDSTNAAASSVQVATAVITAGVDVAFASPGLSEHDAGYSWHEVLRTLGGTGNFVAVSLSSLRKPADTQLRLAA